MFVFRDAHLIKEIIIHLETCSIQFIVPNKGPVIINGYDEIGFQSFQEIIGVLKFFVRVTETPFLAHHPPGGNEKNDIHLFELEYAEKRNLRANTSRMAKKFNPLR